MNNDDDDINNKGDDDKSSDSNDRVGADENERRLQVHFIILGMTGQHRAGQMSCLSIFAVET